MLSNIKLKKNYINHCIPNIIMRGVVRLRYEMNRERSFKDSFGFIHIMVEDAIS